LQTRNRLSNTVELDLLPDGCSTPAEIETKLRRGQ